MSNYGDEWLTVYVIFKQNSQTSPTVAHASNSDYLLL